MKWSYKLTLPQLRLRQHQSLEEYHFNIRTYEATKTSCTSCHIYWYSIISHYKTLLWFYAPKHKCSECLSLHFSPKFCNLIIFITSFPLSSFRSAPTSLIPQLCILSFKKLYNPPSPMCTTHTPLCVRLGLVDLPRTIPWNTFLSTEGITLLSSA